MAKNLSKTTMKEVSEGDVLVAVKFGGDLYAMVFRFDDPQLVEKVKNNLEVTRKELL